MTYADNEVIMSLLRLRSSVDFQNVITWFKSSLVKQSVGNNAQANEVFFRQTQGRNLELSDILKEFENAEGTFEQRKKEAKAQKSSGIS